ncbi:MAG: sel1 repeat family protein, partial [Muribaculaceae bacterium]|nr:sel1 repeat family protein [Muribaculaceae bacterium]
NWFYQAAAKGHAEAQYRLADCYHHGYGVKKNKQEAINWYQKAANQGYAKAVSSLRELGN